jgi:hypothetical protein
MMKLDLVVLGFLKQLEPLCWEAIFSRKVKSVALGNLPMASL